MRFDAAGRRRVDLRAVFALALPMFLNSLVQVVLNLTDTWFVAHISTQATAAVGAVYFLVMVFLFIPGGIGMGLQTLVAQSVGAGEPRVAGRLTWAALWLALATVPFFWWISELGPQLLAPFGLPDSIAGLALRFWKPRMWGGPLSVAIWIFTSFFNATDRPRLTLYIMLVVAVANALLNALFVRALGMGVAGSALATTCALGIGTLLGLLAFVGPATRRVFGSPRAWASQWDELRRVLAIGIPTGLFPAADLIGLSLFQLMMARLGAIDGAASQLVMMITSIAYLPAIGIGLAGTTLVGQAVGAGDSAWAMKLGTRTVILGVVYMGGLGILLASFGGWMLGAFLDAADPASAATLVLARQLLWIAAAYQVFDAVNLVSAFCLRGAGDVKLPPVFLLLASWGVFIPLTHALAFKKGAGYVDFLPQFGLGAVGGWIAALVYIVLLAVILYARWRSGAWKGLRV